MAKFLTGNELNFELEKLLNRADEQIILISPYIKLHDRYISALRTKKENPNIRIIVVFGKNEEDMSRSMKEEDFNFFKDFPDIEIRYERRLHAKYYASESTAILTSMNLYTFSHDNNIEAGVMTKATLLSNLANNIMLNITREESFDDTAFNYFNLVIDQSELLYKNAPQFDNGMFGLSKKYKSSTVEMDKLTDFFTNRSKYDNAPKKHIERSSFIKVDKPDNIQLETSSEIEIISEDHSDIKYISTTALSKELGVSSKDLFSKFETLNWIERKDNNWLLTNSGIIKGAQNKRGQYGEYIAWPSTILNELK
ncbi:MAG: phospholipase D family protein [Cytophagaceae bacterium]|nr:phospholipase D family protein [Cytophagaceae bacterium]